MLAPPTNRPHAGVRLKELDGWRAISVLLVIADHLGAYRYARHVLPHRHLASFLQDSGPLGVKIFFVISGFVICRLLLSEERQHGAASLRAFYIRRFFRILPPLILFLATIWVLHSLAFLLETRRAIVCASLFLLDFNLKGVQSWFVGHTWSLAVEEQFYLIFPALWIATRSIGRFRFFTGVFFLIVIWNLSAAILNWDQFIAPSARTGFACICCGVLIASAENGARHFARKTPGIAVLIVAIILLWHPTGRTGCLAALYESVFAPLSIGLLLIFSLEHRGWLGAFLCWTPVQAIGLTSYGLYLWQELFTARASDFTVLGQAHSHYLLLAVLMVPISYLFVEKPAMRLGRSISSRVRRQFLTEPAVA